MIRVCITEPALLQDALHQSEQRDQDLLESFSDGVAILTPEGLVLDINQRLIADAQTRREEVVGKRFTDFPSWSSAPAAGEQLRAAIEQASRGETVRFETRIRPQAGTYVDLAMMLTPHRDVSKRVTYLICTARNITERKHEEEELHALVDAIPQLVWIAGPDGYITYNNQRLTGYLAMTPEQVKGHGWMAGVHPDDQQRVWNAWQTSIQTGVPYEVEYRLQDGTSGAYRWFLARALPMRNEAGQITKWFGTGTNIDEQKRTEKALRQSQEKMRALMDSSIIGIAIVEGEEVVEANDTYLRMTGYSREDLSHRRMNWVRMTPPEYMARTQQAHQELAIHHYMTPYEKEYICKDGSRLPILAGGVILPFDPTQNIYFVLDNSARKELEQRKGDFISMAGHEFRTPLTSVKMQVQLVRRRLVKQGLHEAAAALSQVEEPVKQLESLVGEILDVSKIQAGRLEYVQEPVDLEALLGKVAQTTQQMSTTHTVVVRGAAPRTLIGDKGRLEQVFINLISNAMKYSPGATTVEIDLSASTETVTVSVRDHGIGIPQAQREKIFERFYRASDLRQGAVPGLGMGLYIAAEIVRHHGGTMRIESDIGHGATFHVTLPLKSPIIPQGDPVQR